jgi:Uma2 family endonuclease
MIRKFTPFVLNDYPTSDGRPMAETDWHRDLMLQLIATLKAHYAADPNTYVSGNLLVFYRPNDRRRHVSPDVFVVKAVRDGLRPNYLVWEEGKGPDVVIELTSKTTRREDLNTKMALYRDTLKVKEYFLFDPREEYLEPSMQGFRLVGGEYRRIREKDGRLPSKVLCLHLERDGDNLRLWNPATETWLPTDAERADDAEQRAAAAEAELARLRRLIADRGHGTNGH